MDEKPKISPKKVHRTRIFSANKANLVSVQNHPKTIALASNSDSNGNKNGRKNSTVKQSTSGLTKYLAMDCETVESSYNGHIDILARVSIVNEYGDCIYDKFVKPSEQVTNYKHQKKADLFNGEEFTVVQKEVSELLRGHILVGYLLKRYLSILFLSHPAQDIRDIARFKPFLKLTKGKSLMQLAKDILGINYQNGKYSSVEKAYAAMQLYCNTASQWEIELQKRQHHTNPNQTVASHNQIVSKNRFEDKNIKKSQNNNQFTRSYSCERQNNIKQYSVQIDNNTFNLTNTSNVVGVAKFENIQTESSDKTQCNDTNNQITKCLAMDCLMIDIGIDNCNPPILARVSIVNVFGDCIYDKFIKPSYEVIRSCRTVSNIMKRDLLNGEVFTVAQRAVSELLKGRILVGHSVKKHLSIMQLSHPEEDIRDATEIKAFAEAKSSKLFKRLHDAVLDKDIKHGGHNSLQNARIAMQQYCNAPAWRWEKALGKKHRPNQAVASHSGIDTNEQKFLSTDNNIDKGKKIQGNGRSKLIWIPISVHNNLKTPNINIVSDSFTNSYVTQYTDKNNRLTKRLAMDCEVVRCISKDGTDYMLTHVSIVNEFGDCIYDEDVQPSDEVISYQQESVRNDLFNGKQFTVIQKELSGLLKDCILIGYLLNKYLSLLSLTHPKQDTRDIAQYTPYKKLTNARSLKRLVNDILGINIQLRGNRTLENARLAMQLYYAAARHWEIENQKTHHTIVLHNQMEAYKPRKSCELNMKNGQYAGDWKHAEHNNDLLRVAVQNDSQTVATDSDSFEVPISANNVFGNGDVNINADENNHLMECLAIDCELVDSGNGLIVTRVSIVNYSGDCIYDKFVRPIEFEDYSTSSIDVRNVDLLNCDEFSAVQKEVSELLRGRIVVGQSLKKYLGLLRLSHPICDVRDIAKYVPFKKIKNYRNLTQLAKSVLGVDIADRDYTSVENARIAMQLYGTVCKYWEVTLKKNRRLSSISQTKASRGRTDSKKKSKNQKVDNTSAKPSGTQNRAARINRKQISAENNLQNFNLASNDDLVDATESINIATRSTSDVKQSNDENNRLKKFLAMDCEMVGTEKGDMLARVSIVNEYGECIYDNFVKPTRKVTDYRTPISGVRESDLLNAKTFAVVRREVSNLLTNSILVGHSSKKDLFVLRLPHPEHDIRDTSTYKPFKRITNGRTPSLKRLAKEILGIDIQDGEHSSVEDARAAMQLYCAVAEKWEITHEEKRHRFNFNQTKINQKQINKPNKSCSQLDGNNRKP